MKITVTAFAILGLAATSASYRLFAQAESRSVWDGVYTEAQAGRGQASYNQHCAACHGDTLSGGEMAPALAGSDFLSNWSGLTAGDLFERIRTTMPLNNPGGLSRPVMCDILAYILSANKFPAGQTELPTATEVLRLIRIDASKPEPKQ
jgi:S-disulfanyl-L-cysteine oxidoreductase SoxD